MSFMHLAQPCPKCSHPMAEHSPSAHTEVADCQRIGCSCRVTTLEVLKAQGPASPSLLQQMEEAIKRMPGPPPATLMMSSGGYQAFNANLGQSAYSSPPLQGISVTMSNAIPMVSGSYAVTMTHDPGRYRIKRTPEEERAEAAARENAAAVERLRAVAKEEAQKNLDAAVQRRKATAKWGDE